ncbi:hypothetical protein EJ04DRAFT_462661 [Polyplosphaeria fusca]|uniref:Uncharacterized protein n=1 Tax=Polyplosphaeria fusca TaxID=682080 RepID=A0A9P4QZS2_9PLEO|nr:hypothetical protein EJ04DRAFT_462661 [Polyplosphaeria fusca]
MSRDDKAEEAVARDGGDQTADVGEEGAARRPEEEHQQQEAAAQLIQRNYRGYRVRRQLEGQGLDASTRWSEAIREARWRNATSPMSRAERQQQTDRLSSPTQRTRAGSEAARQKWKRVGEIARRAGGDDPEDSSANENEMSVEERAEYKKRKSRQKTEREKTAKMMDLQYFLEMVDGKHRYVPNLGQVDSLIKHAQIRIEPESVSRAMEEG